MTEKAKDNTVFIGKKPTMAYVLAAMMQFSDGQSNIQIKARGRSISKAVDVAEIVRNRFVQSTKVDSIKIGTETLENERKEKMNVSTIEITLKK